MSNVPVFVGLDYHQDSIQVCVLNPQGDGRLNRSARNDCDELYRLVNPLSDAMRKRGKPACVVVGAVGNRWVRTLHHAMKEPQAIKEPQTVQ